MSEGAPVGNSNPSPTAAGKGKGNFFQRNKVGIIAGGFVLVVMFVLLVKGKGSQGSGQDSGSGTGYVPPGSNNVPDTGSYVTESELQNALSNLISSGLKGAKGDKGDKGPAGPPGKPGHKNPPPKPKPHHRPPREHED